VKPSLKLGARLLVVLNPHAGGGRGAAALRRAEIVLRSAGCTLQVLATQRPGHARELLATAPASVLGGGCDGVVVVGGDGTLHEVVNGLMERRAAGRGEASPPIGLVPAGSGNSLAADLGLSDAEDAARRIVAGGVQPLDVMELRLDEAPAARPAARRTLYAFNIVGWGLAADAGARAESLRWLGPRRYALANVLELLRRRVRPARLRLLTERSEEVLEGRYVMALACNTQHTGRGLRLAPRAQLDDGLMDLLVVPEMSRRRLIALMHSVPEGGHLEAPDVRVRQVRGFEVVPGEAGEAAAGAATRGSAGDGGPAGGAGADASRASDAAGGPAPAADTRLNVDGEIVPCSPRSLEVRLLPRALALLGADRRDGARAIT
jgi:diacylglycerol kinase (ATP)